ncbi:MAG: FtsX-like permease family protein, partial [Eubacteriales bacterium]|nr:FtsX-like permease family protein [Eubacteriales bacterium]
NEAKLTAAEAEIAQNETRLIAAENEIAENEAKLTVGEREIAENEAKLTAAESEIAENEARLLAGDQEIAENEAKLTAAEAEIAENEAKLESGRRELEEGTQKLNEARREIAENEQKLLDGETELAEAEKTIADGEAEIEENEKKLSDALKELTDGEKEYQDGEKEYQDARKEAEEEIADGERKIQDAEKEIAKLSVPEWYITDRNDLPEYSDYGDNADRIRNIGRVFPILFFLVAALISLTTMTRMVEEYRTQIGTMKALGYGKLDIASKYLSYAFLATVGGSILGVLVGEKIIPYIIIKAYGIMYFNMATHLRIDYEFKFALIAAGISIVCTLGATFSSCFRALMETPASLMRPPAPKEGKRVFLERIPVIWRNLSFTWKSTARNLFRYKKRLLMTIFGIAGSMALMLVGFGIRDSIMDIAVRQYESLQHYDGMIIKNDEADRQEEEELFDALDEMKEISHYSEIKMVQLTAPRGRSNLSVYLYIPANLENFEKDVTLQDRRTKEQYSLTDEGAVICEKTASLLGLRKGDTLILEEDKKQYSVKVAEICENYMSHYVYMTPAVYEQTFGKKAEYNSIVYQMKPEYDEELETVGQKILEEEAALSISYTSSLKGQLDRMLTTLGSVIWVLIISAGMLAFVVLYNLNNINITERQRELATLKVLGFYDGEVSQYVFRENILLTILGVIAGVFMGIALHRYVIVTVEVDSVMFGRNINWQSFVYSALITCGFSAFVNMVMHFRLKKIDMVESLKSVE